MRAAEDLVGFYNLGVLEGLVLVGTKVHDDRTNPDPLHIAPFPSCDRVCRFTHLVPGGSSTEVHSQSLRQFHYCSLQQVSATEHNADVRGMRAFRETER